MPFEILYDLQTSLLGYLSSSEFMGARSSVEPDGALGHVWGWFGWCVISDVCAGASASVSEYANACVFKLLFKLRANRRGARSGSIIALK